MAFRIIKQWLFSGLSRHRSSHGQLVVSSEGDAIVVVRFHPTLVKVEFLDEEPPIDPCSPHPHDQLNGTLTWLGHGRWGVKINWSVWSTRRVKYEVEGYC